MNPSESDPIASKPASTPPIPASVAIPRHKAALRKLQEATPLLKETLSRHWSTGQGTRIRHILWSLYYSCGHLVNLGDACTGLDDNLADAVSAAINARLVFGPGVEPLLGEILRASGEFARFDRQ